MTSNQQFVLPIYIDLTAVFLFGLTGGLAAVKRGYDVIGLFAMTFVTAVGGSLIRDGIFIQNGPPAVIEDTRYLIAVAAATVISVPFRHHVKRFNRVIAWFDALGLGAYAVVGMQKAFQAHLGTAAAVLIGVINASGGGLLRDVLVSEEPLLFKPGQFYVLAAFAGCVLFAFLLERLDMEITKAALITIGVTFVIRVLAIQFNWTSRALSQIPTVPTLSE